VPHVGIPAGGTPAGGGLQLSAAHIITIATQRARKCDGVFDADTGVFNPTVALSILECIDVFETDGVVLAHAWPFDEGANWCSPTPPSINNQARFGCRRAMLAYERRTLNEEFILGRREALIEGVKFAPLTASKCSPTIKAIIAGSSCPVLISLAIEDAAWEKVWEENVGAIALPAPPVASSMLDPNYNVRHAVVITGYDDAKGWFEFKNSWGQMWGDFGYSYLPYEYVDRFSFQGVVGTK
jgi:hypothetical protein